MPSRIAAAVASCMSAATDASDKWEHRPEAKSAARRGAWNWLAGLSGLARLLFSRKMHGFTGLAKAVFVFAKALLQGDAAENSSPKRSRAIAAFAKAAWSPKAGSSSAPLCRWPWQRCRASPSLEIAGLQATSSSYSALPTAAKAEVSKEDGQTGAGVAAIREMQQQRSLSLPVAEQKLVASSEKPELMLPSRALASKVDAAPERVTPMLPNACLLRKVSEAALAMAPSPVSPSKPKLFLPAAAFTVEATAVMQADPGSPRLPYRISPSKVSFSESAEWLLFGNDESTSKPVVKLIPIPPQGTLDCDSPRSPRGSQVKSTTLFFDELPSSPNSQCVDAHSAETQLPLDCDLDAPGMNLSMQPDASFVEAQRSAATPKARAANAPRLGFCDASNDATTPQVKLSPLAPMGFSQELQTAATPRASAAEAPSFGTSVPAQEAATPRASTSASAQFGFGEPCSGGFGFFSGGDSQSDSESVCSSPRNDCEQSGFTLRAQRISDASEQSNCPHGPADRCQQPVSLRLPARIFDQDVSPSSSSPHFLEHMPQFVEC